MARLSRVNKYEKKVSKWNLDRILIILNILLTVSLIYINLR